MTAGMYQRIKDFIIASAASTPGVYDCASQGSCSATVSFIGSAKATLQVSDTQNIASNLSIPSLITVRRVGAGKLQIPYGVTLTAVSPEQFDADVRTQLFEFTGAGTGVVAFTTAGAVPITWCGATLAMRTTIQPRRKSATTHCPGQRPVPSWKSRRGRMCGTANSIARPPIC